LFWKSLTENASMDLGELTFEAAKSLAGTTFEVALPGGRTTSLTLRAALAYEVSGRAPPDRPRVRAPFSMYFRGSPAEIIPQGCYRLTTERVKWEAIFLVPVGRDEAGTEYEAVFN
jgi:hypothetical protein